MEGLPHRWMVAVSAAILLFGAITATGGYTNLRRSQGRGPGAVSGEVIGVPNPDRPADSVVQLVVQKSPSYRAMADYVIRKELIGFCRERMAPYKVPKIIEFVDAIPLTRVGKVDKKSLRKPGSIE